MQFKKAIYILIFFGFLIAPITAQGQTPPVPSPTYPLPSPLPTMPTNVSMLGVNCGNSFDTNSGTNKCCYSPPIEPKLIDWGFPFDGVASIINNALKDRLNPILEMQKQVKTQPCSSGSPSVPGDLGNPACICVEPTVSPLSAILPLCERINPNSKAKGMSERQACIDCLTGKGGATAGTWTSVGCVYGNISSFIQETVLGWGIGLAGGFSMLCLMYGAFMMQTSRGNAESIKKAQQLITSCITGLMLTIFSVFILRLIGVSVLKIPGFTP